MKIQVTENSVNKKYDLLKKYSKLTLVNIVAIKTIKNIIDFQYNCIHSMQYS